MASGLLTLVDGFASSRLVPRCFGVSDRTAVSELYVRAWASSYLSTAALSILWLSLTLYLYTFRSSHCQQEIRDRQHSIHSMRSFI